MNKISKRFCTILFLTALLLCSTYAALIPSARASDVTLQQKGQEILKSVIGIDVAKYSVVTSKVTQESYLEATTQDNVQFELNSGTRNLQLFCTFVKGNLQILNVLNNTGSQLMLVSASNPLDMAKGFLSRYSTYSGNTLYRNLESTLTNIDASKSLSMLFGNTELNVTTYADSTTFRWTYKYNGILAPEKCVVLNYKNGFLKYLIDNWDLYKIGSTSINLSAEDAVSNGLTEAKGYSWAMVSNDSSIIQLKDFNVTGAMLWDTTFSNALTSGKARDHDPFTLYPMRHVWVSLDKFYPGNVYGIEVFFWADTKSLYSIQERCTTFDNLQESVPNVTPIDSSVNSVSICTFAIQIIVVSALLLSSLLFTKRKSAFQSKAFTLLASLFCILLLSCTFIETVSAVNRNALIWGSRSSGAYDARLGMSWRKTATEVSAQSSTTSYIADRFSNYATYSGVNNYQGVQSVKSSILDNISSSQTNYPFTAVLDFDHGVGNTRYDYVHSMFEDDIGCRVGPYDNWAYADDNGVYDYEIYDRTGGISYQSKAYFDYISTCMSADLVTFGQYRTPNNVPVGMPYCWTHRIVEPKSTPGFNTGDYMSQYGYSDPDDGNYCFIGFPRGSAALSQTIEEGYPSYSAWISNFYGWALMYGLTVHDALDEASLNTFTCDFGSTNLTTGFLAIWPMYEYNATTSQYQWDNTYGSDSTLAVYGNSNVYLRGPELTVNAYDGNGSPISANVYIDGNYAGTTGNTFRVSLDNYHTIQVSSTSYTFHSFTGYPDFQNPITFEIGPYDATVTANYYANPPPSYDLYVSCGSGGSLNITSGDNYFTPQSVTVVATPNSGYSFGYWVLDGNQYYGSSIDAPMNNGHNLQAVFTPTYLTAVNYYVTYDGYNYVWFSTNAIYEPGGSNYLGFGSYFVAAYNYNDGWHYSDPDWYDLGTGTTIDVYYDLSNG